jgi:hypothetical protein
MCWRIITSSNGCNRFRGDIFLSEQIFELIYQPERGNFMKIRNKQSIILMIILVISGFGLTFGQSENNEHETRKIIEITIPENWSFEPTKEIEFSYSPGRKAVIKKIVTRYPDLETAVDNILNYLKKEFTNIREIDSEEDESDGLVRVLTNYRATSKADRKPVYLTTQLAALPDDPDGSVILYIGIVKQGAGGNSG